MRLIDAEKLEKFIEDGLNNADKNKRFGHDAIEIMTEVHFSETVDAVPVVRCKDCKFRTGLPGQPNILCGQMKENDFCSYGEKVK
ncbi:hypothetical protein AALC17_01620 [Oscillospiraceae bacterium 38-13]